MIQIIPSIAISEGNILRIEEGDYLSSKVENISPVDLALLFEDHGLEVLHMVDLDGARRGRPVNYHILEAVAGHTGMKVDFSGGIQTDGDISKAYEYGAKYITAASIAVSHKELFASWIISYGREKITLGADGIDGKVKIRGWLKETDVDLLAHIEYFYDRGLKYVKTTDISKDGSLSGPSFDLYEEIIKRFPGICVLASGGVRTMDDVKKLNDLGVFAVIIGKAMYEGTIKLDEIATFRGQVNT